MGFCIASMCCTSSPYVELLLKHSGPGLLETNLCSKARWNNGHQTPEAYEGHEGDEGRGSDEGNESDEGHESDGQDKEARECDFASTGSHADFASGL